MTTLASKTLVSAIFDDVVDMKTLASSIKAIYSVSDWTPGAGIGPLLVGVAHSDYGSTDIEQYIENGGAWQAQDLVNKEISSRQIRQIGTLVAPDDATKGSVLNDGKPITTKLNWMLFEGQSLRLWAYNLGTAAFATTVPTLQANGHCNLWTQ